MSDIASDCAAVENRLFPLRAIFTSAVVDVCLCLKRRFLQVFMKIQPAFFHQGKQNDTNREFRAARNDGKFIVSPHWMTACMETGTRADESQFPHVYNPNKSIQVREVITAWLALNDGGFRKLLSRRAQQFQAELHARL